MVLPKWFAERISGSAAETVADFPGLSGSRQRSFFVPTLKQTLVTFYF